MIGTIMNALILRVLIFAGLVFFIPAGTACAEEKTFPNFNVAVTPPDAWSDVTASVHTTGLIVAYRDSAQNRIVMLLANENPAMIAEIDDHWVDGFERGMERSGGSKRASGHFITVQGCKSYERTGTRPVNGRSLSTVARAIPVRGRVYLVEAMRSDGKEAADDAEIHQFLESFRFLQPPPALLFGGKSAAYRTGYLIGQLMVAGLVIGGIALAIVFIRRPRQSQSWPPPPPPPPSVPPPLPK
jgi:hypothetical protein